MENVEETHIEGKNLVGIIPIAGHEKYDFKTPWPHCLMSIAPDYTLIEAAVAECACAGCKSIWIVVNDDFAPIIRKKCGDWCGDPVWSFRSFDPKPGESKRRIPIFYVPVPLKNRNRIDCLSWSVLHGALSVFKLSSSLSKWTTPSKYYVRFPHSFMPPHQIREFRKQLVGPKNCYMSFNGKTVKDGLFASFTFGKDDWVRFRRVVRSSTGVRVPGTTPDDNQNLPPEERWSARWFGVDKVFAPLDLTDATEIKVNDFFNVRSWQEYVDFLCYTQKKMIRKPVKSILFASTYNKVGVDRDEEG